MYKPDIVIGCARSAVTTPLAQLTSLHSVPQISYFSTSTKLDDSSTYPTFLRTIPSDSLVALSIGQLFHGPLFKSKRVSMIYVNDGYGTSYMEALHDACTFRSIKFDSYAFTFNNKDSIRLALQSMKEEQVRYIVAVVFDDDLEFMMKTASELGIAGTEKGEHLWVFTDSAQNFAELEDSNARAAIDGAIRILPNGKGPNIAGWNRLATSWSSIANPTSLVSEFNERLPPLNVTDPSFSYQLDEDILSKPLKDVPVSDGAPFLYDAIISAGLAACAAEKQAKAAAGGGGVSSTTFKKYFNGSAIYAKALEQSFSGVTGTVEYNGAGSRSATTARIEMYNLKITGKDFRTALVGFYNKGNWSLLKNNDGDHLMVFANGMSTPPPWRDEPIVDYNLIDSSIIATVYVLMAKTVLGAIFCSVWTLRKWNEPIVKASQPAFLLLICLGTIISTFAILPLSFDSSAKRQAGMSEDSLNAACRSIVPLCSLGFTTMFASLFAKQFRVWLVFLRASKMKKVRHDKKDTTLRFVLGIVSVVVGVNGVLLLIADVLAPLHWVETPLSRDSYGVVTSSISQCLPRDGSANGQLNWTMNVIIIVYLFTLIIVGNIMSFITKDLPSKFQESKWIAYAMVATFEVFAIGLPLMILAGDGQDGNASASFATRSLFALSTNIAVLSFIFSPKIVDHYKLSCTSLRRFQVDVQKRLSIKEPPAEGLPEKSGAESSKGTVENDYVATSSGASNTTETFA